MRKFLFKITPKFLFVLLLFSTVAYTTPSFISEVDRDQYEEYNPSENNIMRIWIAYVGQGDGILIQLPKKIKPDSETLDNIIDITIDGGANTFFGKFLDKLYDDYESYLINYSIITHFDDDHFNGLNHMMKRESAIFDRFYHGGQAIFKKGYWSDETTKLAGAKKRFMGNFPNGKMSAKYMIKDFKDLKKHHPEGYYKRYGEFVTNLIQIDNSYEENTVYNRVYYTDDHQNDLETQINGLSSDLELTLLWPNKTLYNYKNIWSKTINGNSVTFLLKYDDFEMLFTGDLNNYSEDSLLSFLRSENMEHLLECDVLKVPHHGAGEKHASYDFFKKSKLEPVVSVASMGGTGFKSKIVSGPRTGWQHPSDSLIRMLGGANRFFSTYVKEQSFLWKNMIHKDSLTKLIEKTHILIETDGKRFRIVEIDADKKGPITIPIVENVDRGDGTWWIEAR
ncbi:MAG: hypothetical protein GY865_16400 [candidate division Zixibacteria bacterium]|nr:hypothetical protein [candidate division Zixibacteria bacterium]